MRPWFFRFQARFASRIGLGARQQLQHAAVVVLADLRPVRLGHDHAHQVVRLRVERRDAHGVAGVCSASASAPLPNSSERQRLGGGQVVGIEPHDALQSASAARLSALRRADFCEQRERSDVQRRALEEIDEQTLRLLDAPRPRRRAQRVRDPARAPASARRPSRRASSSDPPGARCRRRTGSADPGVPTAPSGGLPTAYSKASPRPLQDRGVMLITAARSILCCAGRHSTSCHVNWR